MRRRRQAREWQEKRERENRRPTLKMLCAALLRLFRGQHSEKMKESARGNWDPREGQQPFRPNPNGVGDRNTTLRRLLIGAVWVGSQWLLAFPRVRVTLGTPLTQTIHLQCWSLKGSTNVATHQTKEKNEKNLRLLL